MCLTRYPPGGGRIQFIACSHSHRESRSGPIKSSTTQQQGLWSSLLPKKDQIFDVYGYGGLIAAMPLDPAVKSELQAVVSEAQQTGIVVGMQKVLAKLSSSGLLRVQQIAPQFVGCHPLNRDGFGVSASHTHGLLGDICSVGFDAKQIDAICMDVASEDIFDFNHRLAEESGGASHTHGLLGDICSVGFDAKQIDAICMDVASEDIFDFNHRLAEESGGALPPIAKHQLRHASLSASHTNAALRCILASTPHDPSSPLVVQGKLQLEQAGLDNSIALNQNIFCFHVYL